MRAIKNLIEELEILDPDHSLTWAQVYGAEILGRAIGHDIEYRLMAGDGLVGYSDMILPPLPRNLVRYHIVSVL